MKGYDSQRILYSPVTLNKPSTDYGFLDLVLSNFVQRYLSVTTLFLERVPTFSGSSDSNVQSSQL